MRHFIRDFVVFSVYLAFLLGFLIMVGALDNWDMLLMGAGTFIISGAGMLYIMSHNERGRRIPDHEV